MDRVDEVRDSAKVVGRWHDNRHTRSDCRPPSGWETEAERGNMARETCPAISMRRFRLQNAAAAEVR